MAGIGFGSKTHLDSGLLQAALVAVLVVATRGVVVTSTARAAQRRLIKVDFDNLEVITLSHSPAPAYVRVRWV
ncbi:unnamed protein product [Arctia plantaginis]|uniref:Uncharacterized protein n=1 Tax=Arctia plantaginis TaxID=874455 RepID=A0A8S1BHN1_ARCPL|nr:unnamed protein product [Arctia plantaginis]